MNAEKQGSKVSEDLRGNNQVRGQVGKMETSEERDNISSSLTPLTLACI